MLYEVITNIFARSLRRSRLLLVFGFGLLHGMGFASMLQEFGMPDDAFATALISRITSYNVCYTKLLRVLGISSHLVFPCMTRATLCRLIHMIRMRWSYQPATAPRSVFRGIINMGYYRERPGSGRLPKREELLASIRDGSFLANHQSTTMRQKKSYNFV